MFQQILRATFVLILVAVAGTDSWGAAALARRPYLQSVGRDRVTLMWRTSTPARQSVDYTPAFGYVPGFLYDYSSAETAASTRHELTLTGLQPGTTYRYRLREDSTVVASGDAYTFQTDAGPQDPQFAFFATADIGEDPASGGQQEATQAMIRRLAPRADFGLVVGDVVYPDGRSSDYDANLMRPWADLLCNTTAWPVPGNHDWRVDPDSNFAREWSLPGNEHYYSFDYGNAHFIGLDTGDGFLYDETNQLAWLENELRTRRDATWTFVFYHFPLHTCTYKGDEPELRDKLLPILDRYHVDVVFNGHAHTYERLYPILGLQPVDQAQNPYYTDPHGTIYIVSGAGAKIKTGKPTTYCGPTAAFVDERIVFTQVFVEDHRAYILTFDSFTGEVVDVVAINKSPRVAAATWAPAPQRLLQNVPNPFNPSTRIPFVMAARGRARLRVLAPDGRWIADLADGVFLAGPQQVLWDGRDARGAQVASGGYVCELQAGGRTEAIKMTLVR